jgi:hypothetical protein
MAKASGGEHTPGAEPRQLPQGAEASTPLELQLKKWAFLQRLTMSVFRASMALCTSERGLREVSSLRDSDDVFVAL